MRERLLSNSPDPVKSNIMGWSPQASVRQPLNGMPTTPLRIAKRDSRDLTVLTHQSPSRPFPSDLARRSSSSFKHVKTNHLVTKSPFKSNLSSSASPSRSKGPTTFPSPRRVSGEKRPRPLSMEGQAELENERPFALKRERCQSKAFQGLIQKEPVTNSPFRRPGELPPRDPEPPVPRPPLTAVTPSRIPTTVNNSPSPARSSLVSRRLHGPRLSGGRRERRKTVTFDERCNVVEFDREEDSFDMDED
ncbi:hypothetical protein FISHEDRAFT_24446, partial [Fistulina hepatica ATCC 64428]